MGELLLASSAHEVMIHSLSGDCSQMHQLSRFSPHPHTTTGVAFNHTGRALLSCGDDGSIMVSRQSGSELFRLPIPSDQSGPLQCLAISKGSRYLASGGEDGYARLWDLKLKRVVRTLPISSHTSVTRVEFNQNGTVMAAATELGTVVVYSIEMNKKVAELKPSEENHQANQAAIRGMSFSSGKNDALATCSDTGSVYVWDITTQSMNASFPKAHKSSASDVCFSPVNRSLMVSVGLDKNFLFLDSTKSKVVRSVTAPEALTCVSFSPTGDKLAMGTSFGSILVYDPRSGKDTFLHQVHAHEPGPVNCIRFYIPSQGNKKPDGRDSNSVTSSNASSFASAVSKARLDQALKVSSTTSIAKNDSFHQHKNNQSLSSQSSTTETPSRDTSRLKTHGMSLFSPAVPAQTASSKVRIPGLGKSRSQLGATDTRLRVLEEETREILGGPSHAASKEPERVETTKETLPWTVEKEQQSRTRSPEDPTPLNIGSMLSTKKGYSPESVSSARTNITDEDSQSERDPGELHKFSRPDETFSSAHSNELARLANQATVGVPEPANDVSGRFGQVTSGVQMTQRLDRLENAVAELREDFRADLNNLQLELMRQFRLQMNDISDCLNEYSSKFAAVMDENKRLRAENERLRNLY